MWNDPPEVDGSLHLPSRNEFIPSDFSIRSENMSNHLANETSPICILDEPLLKFWYKLDNTFKHPRANTYFRINLKGGYDDVKSCVLTELFIHLLKDEMNEIIYQVNNLTEDFVFAFVLNLDYGNNACILFFSKSSGTSWFGQFFFCSVLSLALKTLLLVFPT